MKLYLPTNEGIPSCRHRVLRRLMIVECGEGGGRVEDVHAAGRDTAAAAAVLPNAAIVPARAAANVGPQTTVAVDDRSGWTGVPVHLVARLAVFAGVALIPVLLLALGPAAGQLQVLCHGLEAGLLLLVLVLQLADDLHLHANLKVIGKMKYSPICLMDLRIMVKFG